MSNSTRLSDDDELLVAYLDGELDPAGRRDVDTRLADEEPLRRRLHSLQQAWDALDELPREEPSAAFTASTVSMAAVMAEESQSKAPAAASPTRYGWPSLTRVGSLATLLLLGFLVVFVPRRFHYARELRDLPVAFNLDRYLDAQSLEFLERLDREDLFVDESAMPVDESESPPEENPTASTALRLVTAGQRADIQEALESLNPEQQMQLVELYDRFDRLSASEKHKLRSIHRALSEHPQVDRLTHVLVTFHAWLVTLESSQRADIQDLPESERIDEIRRTLLSQLSYSSDSLWMDLTPREVESIRKWLVDYVQEYRDDILRLLSPMQQRRLSQISNGRSAQLMIAAVAWRLPDIANELPRPSDDETARLVRNLPDRVKRRLAEQLEKEGTAPLFELAARVLRALRQTPRPGHRDRLDDVLNSLPPAERQRLLDLRPDELMRELRRHADQREPREPFGPRRDRRGPPPWDPRGLGPPPPPDGPPGNHPRP